MAILNRTSCCGMRELYIGGSTPLQCMKTVTQNVSSRVYSSKTRSYVQHFGLAFSHVVFTQNVHPNDFAEYDKGTYGYGHRLAAYIKKNKLGNITVSKTATNPNTENPITVFLWTINKAGLERFWSVKIKRST